MASGSGCNLWVWLAGCGWTLWVWLVGVVVRRYIDFLILLIPTPLVSVLFNPRCAWAARVTVVVLCVCMCVFVCPIEILRMAALSIEPSHVLSIKSNYLQN